ncbi:tripeptide aminopeptidase [Caloramator quimbayensis]|uniref:Peptidase T n=1 Tax=Caloramator quimbayensis TaxID=1147123 RepID=A0A1T4Y4F8_9CLOT|nr:peptidase T [Caloramator quimbayensis]SKA96702.1 tripeptide aminopeptidase [Caloramator quimbayensis]
MSGVLGKFLEYVKFDTRSDDESDTTPSTKNQLKLAEFLVKQLKSIGIQDVSMDEYGYVYASLPKNTEKDVPTIGFIAHMDTSPEMAGDGIKPNIIENYDGKDIVLNDEKNIIMLVDEHPHLKNYIGKTIITTDGTTLLGADDKAGIAEIVEVLEYLINHPEIPHGTIKAAFTPDEEVGRGTEKFNLEKFGADFAYTVDGGALGEFEYESFNAADARITINGVNSHPGDAKGKMKNSLLIANELIDMMPKDEIPSRTGGYEGFYHLLFIRGDVEKTNLRFLIRDFDKDKFEERKKFIVDNVDKLNNKYGKDTIVIEVKDQYYNMRQKIEEDRKVVDIALKAIKECNITSKVKPIRGGTDGSALTFKGLLTPNLFTGGHNFHGRYEYICKESMEKAVEVILKIVDICAKELQ